MWFEAVNRDEIELYLVLAGSTSDIEKEYGDITGINLNELFAEEFGETTVKVLK